MISEKAEPDMADEHVLDLLPAYALDCLDEEDLLRLARHLTECDSCRTELSSYQVIADQLPLSVPQVSPPATLKQKLMARVEESRQPGLAQKGKTSWWQRLSERLHQAAPVWALASLAVIVVLAISNLTLWQRVRTTSISEQPQSMRVVRLSNTTDAPNAHGLLVISVDGEYGTLVVDHLPDLGAAQQYQLWLIQGGERTNGGVFSVSQDGYGSLWIASPLPLANYSAFGITIEPAGGSSDPTGQKVLGGNF
jgi:anti-sigma-K factor RskA